MGEASLVFWSAASGLAAVMKIRRQRCVKMHIYHLTTIQMQQMQCLSENFGSYFASVFQPSMFYDPDGAMLPVGLSPSSTP